MFLSFLKRGHFNFARIGHYYFALTGPDRSRPNTKRDPNIVEMQQVFGANFGERLDRFYAVEAERLGISLNTQK